MNLEQYYERYGSHITQDSERLFVDEFLYPLLGSKIENVIPQYPFIDSTGRNRRIDFAYRGNRSSLALEVNGETYHAEGIIPNEMFDDNLFRQNEILRVGYRLVRFSYSQLQSPHWRPVVRQTLRDFFASNAPELLTEYELNPTPLQLAALDALEFYRNARHWRKGVVVLPTGTGKTVLSALDARRHGGRILFLVHRLDILWQSVDAYKLVWPDMRIGFLTGDQRENELDCDVLFASKDSLRKTDELVRFGRDWFDYIVVDEVHHGQSPTYHEVLTYFEPAFMLGMTATPDRTDRRDIFELFDYQKVYEVSLTEAIEQGYLVPFTYYGLQDNVDYSRIRYQNNRYHVGDLERQLIIPERNEAIVAEYLDKGNGDKAIGFCVSIRHAERMAEVFNQHGIPAVAIHSENPKRDDLLASFRNNEFNVAFTVDLFNEGIDIPNVRVLLFLRPTESKTVFLQQLGRGLRLSAGKERVRVLDFIGNYQRANQVRTYLAKNRRVTEVDDNGRRRRKVEYEYSPGCEVIFDPTVEEILNRQDAQELGVSELELQEAYFALAEQLGRKPSRRDLDTQGEYKSALYTQVFGSWVAFLR
jgi:superfamily II DNA or RNA helicase